jgi:hypothetical protein
LLLCSIWLQTDRQGLLPAATGLGGLLADLCGTKKKHGFSPVRRFPPIYPHPPLYRLSRIVPRKFWQVLFSGPSRVTVSRDGAGEAFRVRPQRSLFGVIFVSVWLIFWARSGPAAFRAEMALPSIFMTIWLIGWAWGMIIAPIGIAWMLWGSETLAVVEGDLHIRARIGPWSRRRIYRGARIRGLRLANVGARGRLGEGPVDPDYAVAIAFRYDGKRRMPWTRLPAAEAGIILTALAANLPPNATEPDQAKGP